MILILQVFSLLCRVVIYMLLGRAILSWFINPYTANPNSFLYKLYGLLTSLTEPLVRPARRIMSRFNTGPVDFSLFLAIIFIMVLQRVVIWIFNLTLI